MRAVGTFCLAKKDVSGENKKKERKRKRDLLAERRRRGGWAEEWGEGGPSVQWAPVREQT